MRLRLMSKSDSPTLDALRYSTSLLPCHHQITISAHQHRPVDPSALVAYNPAPANQRRMRRGGFPEGEGLLRLATVPDVAPESSYSPSGALYCSTDRSSIKAEKCKPCASTMRKKKRNKYQDQDSMYQLQSRAANTCLDVAKPKLISRSLARIVGDIYMRSSLLRCTLSWISFHRYRIVTEHGRRGVLQAL